MKTLVIPCLTTPWREGQMEMIPAPFSNRLHRPWSDYDSTQLHTPSLGVTCQRGHCPTSFHPTPYSLLWCGLSTWTLSYQFSPNSILPPLVWPVNVDIIQPVFTQLHTPLVSPVNVNIIQPVFTQLQQVESHCLRGPLTTHTWLREKEKSCWLPCEENRPPDAEHRQDGRSRASEGFVCLLVGCLLA